ncbi:hypothetical protein, partial [uncultured Acidaminococcus sp.]|uniref:hypothetical protein n=1 Tax=uncultured Acidaminococcus sp. TaxID=352152 RepID=UPI00280537CA
IATEIYFKIGLTSYSWSTPLVPEVGDMGQENGFFDNPVSVIFHWSAAPNAVGDCPRRAHPGLRVLWSKADAGASAILTG